ncbi:MAG: ATP-binding protein, partial [Candidatus Omnitrophica bacterium]|nr:ATP-binding protein [Candidatus Omnitrophota bacterium]
SLLKNEFLQYNIRIVEETQSNIPKVEVDVNKIEQVFINLLMNAVEAMPEGGTITVRTYTKPEEKLVAVDVEDSGPGIPRENMDKIFEPFFTTWREKQGTGLGLPIVKNIIDLHKGKIEIRNKENGKGVRATVMLRAKE